MTSAAELRLQRGGVVLVSPSGLASVTEKKLKDFHCGWGRLEEFLEGGGGRTDERAMAGELELGVEGRLD